MSVERSGEQDDLLNVDSAVRNRPIQDSKLPPDYRVHLVADHDTGESQLQNASFLSKNGWLLEISSLVLAATVLVAIVALLYRYDKKPNPTWSPGITLNTILSFASMVFRACVSLPVASSVSQFCWIWCSKRQQPLRHVISFDQASRGLLGSLQVLYAGIWRCALSCPETHATRH